MELPINFSEAHLIASAIGKLSAKADGLQASNLHFIRDNFLTMLATEGKGFRRATGTDNNGMPIYEKLGLEIMATNTNRLESTQSKNTLIVFSFRTHLPIILLFKVFPQ